MKKWYSSLRYRLIFFMLLTALPALGITYFTGLEQRHEAVQASQREVLSLARLAASNQQMFVENTRMFMTALAHLPALQEDNFTFCDDLFSHLVREHDVYYSTLYVADTNGTILCSAANTHTPADLETCPHYLQTLRATGFVVGDYHVCDVTGDAILGLGLPILDENGKVRLILHVSLDLAWINELVSQAQLPAGSTVYTFDRSGRVLTTYPGSIENPPEMLDPNSFLFGLLKSGEGTDTGPGLDGINRLYSLTMLQGASNNVFLALGIPEEVAFAEANRTLQRNMIILVIMTLLALSVAWILGDVFFLRQTRSLVAATQRLAGGDLATRTNIPYEEGEMGQLAQAFDQMADSIRERERERDQAEAAIREYAQDLEQSNRDLQDFANIASHDLQEPLRKIQTFSELLRERYVDLLDERGQGYLKRMTESAQRMQALIMELLTYSRLTSRGQPFEQIDLGEVAQSVLIDLEIPITETKAQIEIDPLPRLEADRTQMRQLLQNLISNALKFSSDGQIPMIQIRAKSLTEARIRRGQDHPTQYYEIEVTDNGIGFEEKYAHRIFQPFQRLHGRDEYPGTGMGLAICRKIVERHSGSIRAHSEPGLGSTFIVKLPKKQPSKERKIDE